MCVLPDIIASLGQLIINPYGKTVCVSNKGVWPGVTSLFENIFVLTVEVTLVNMAQLAKDHSPEIPGPDSLNLICYLIWKKRFLQM